jgi:WD40 repeat protein
MYNNGDPGAVLAVSRDGSRIAVASTGLKLYVLNAATGDTVLTRPYNATRGLYGVDLSTDGSVVMVSTYDSVEVWRSGVRAPNVPNYGQTPAKISGDGSTIVTGDFSASVRTYRWNGSSYASLWTSNTGHPWVTAVDISADGNWVVAGTFQ